MRLTKENKAKISDRIRAAAAERFRMDGYEGVNLDQVMAGAKLTRGSFYAHFKSKADLFAQVVRAEHPMLRMLKARDGKTAEELRAQMLRIFGGYLSPDNLDDVFRGCTLAALTGDTTRSGDDVKAAYGDALAEICTEMARGQDHAPDDYAPALILATGTVRTAYAVADPAQRDTILTHAQTAFQTLIPR